MGSPKKVEETEDEKAAKEQSRRDALQGERILSTVTPMMAYESKKRYRDIALARTNASINQATQMGPMRGDPSRGRAVSAITGNVLGSRGALSEGLSTAFQRAVSTEDDQRKNAIASGLDVQADTNRTTNQMADTGANAALKASQNRMNRSQNLIDAGSSLAAAGTYSYMTRNKPETTSTSSNPSLNYSPVSTLSKPNTNYSPAARTSQWLTGT